ncbi:hypothetical protein chiPu_0031244, partial [Chiloscyllium punctatum]|nr:hypothetical protein [Chiloscyllium punctatum]
VPLSPAVCGRPDRPPHLEIQRILGGALAQEGNFPWQALLLLPKSGLAGGILVSDRWVLTAAHVFWPKGGAARMPAERMREVRVLAGRVSIREMERAPGTDRVERVVLHPGYRGDSPHFRHDLALVRLGGRFKMAAGAMPGCLPPATAPGLYRPGLAAFVSGWGVTENNTLLDQLRYVRLPLAEFGVCARAMADAQRGREPGQRSEVWQEGMVCAGTGIGGQDS